MQSRCGGLLGSMRGNDRVSPAFRSRVAAMSANESLMTTLGPASRQMPKICIVMPAYNEATRIEQTLASISLYVAAGAPIGPVVLADDGSDDDTIEVAERAASILGLPIEVL